MATEVRRGVYGLAGDWSIFRPKNAFCGQTVGRKHGSVPFPWRKGDSPIFAAVKRFFKATFLTPRKLGQSPVNGYCHGGPPWRVRNADPTALTTAAYSSPSVAALFPSMNLRYCSSNSA